MRSITRRLLWVFVFTVPWDVVSLPGFGGLSRVAGVATLGAALLTTAMEGRVRKPDAIFGFATAYVALTVLSLLWTLWYEATLQYAWTGVQVLGSIWVVKEFARTRDDQQSLLVAFCLGQFVPLAGILNSFRAGTKVWWLRDRYTAMNFNADDLGLTLVIGIPVAWHLMMNYDGALRRTVRVVALLYFALVPLATLLTGTRGAVLAGLVGLTIVPLTLPQRSMRSFFFVVAMLVGVGLTAAAIVPERTWARIFSIKGEILEGGSMTGRADIWKAGLRVFPDRPILGVGVGAYGAAVEALTSKRSAPHNLPLGLLVEQGLVGFTIYAALLVSCGRAIWGMPPPERKLFAALMLSWMVGVMSLNWEYRKVTWLLFGLVAAQAASEKGSRRLAPSPRNLAESPFQPHPLRPVYSPSGAQRVTH